MKILVPIDGSKISETILETVEEIGEKFRAELILLNVINDINLQTGFYSNDLYEYESDKSQEILSEAKEELSDYPYKVSLVSKNGKAYEEIIKLADEEDVDLIAMGNRGLGAFSRTLLGSVSNKVLNHSNKSVLIVKTELEDD
ncbi:Nucleotide-binding universal stress protein, UspA family [Anaerosphaera aminiphila DSM 21120]|uniref:Nucleotide-binding universal stress protein, UspA family n=1 Tax=Anaerosphaera aminiphila DSM 21120 TaxID=1120995 RepID=A0A1M5TAY0_9FIRM|nr:universal stress protein [Anaerosphaera aminiphila]SHH47836.1 Nucleotide-binding universal stress protein, UspA family [Anaerosphaera aminiphila DSM 21120]